MISSAKIRINMQGTKESVEKSLSGNEKTPANIGSTIFAGVVLLLLLPDYFFTIYTANDFAPRSTVRVLPLRLSSDS